MKKMKRWMTFSSILVCIFLTGCGIKSPVGETKTVVPGGVVDFDESDKLDAIYYNGQCYYGLAMVVGIDRGEEPEDFEYIGELSSVIEGYISPTEELSANIDIGGELYHYTDEEGKHYFVTPHRSLQDVEYYRGICQATTRKPPYYEVE